MKKIQQIISIILVICLCPIAGIAEGGYKYGQTVTCSVGDLSYDTFTITNTETNNSTMDGSGMSEYNVVDEDTEYHVPSLLYDSGTDTLTINGKEYSLRGAKKVKSMGDVTNELLGEAANDKGTSVAMEAYEVLLDEFIDETTEVKENEDSFINRVKSEMPDNYALVMDAYNRFGNNGEDQKAITMEDFLKMFGTSMEELSPESVGNRLEDNINNILDALKDQAITLTDIDFDAFEAAVDKSSEQSKQTYIDATLLHEIDSFGYGKAAPNSYILEKSEGSKTTDQQLAGISSTYDSERKAVTILTKEQVKTREKARAVSEAINEKPIEEVVGMMITGKLTVEGETIPLYEYGKKVRDGEPFNAEEFTAAYEASMPYINTFYNYQTVAKANGATTDQYSKIAVESGSRDINGMKLEVYIDEEIAETFDGLTPGWYPYDDDATLVTTGFQDNWPALAEAANHTDCRRYVIPKDAFESNEYDVAIPFDETQKNTMIQTLQNQVKNNNVQDPGINSYFSDGAYQVKGETAPKVEVTKEEVDNDVFGSINNGNNGTQPAQETANNNQQTNETPYSDYVIYEGQDGMALRSAIISANAGLAYSSTSTDKNGNPTKTRMDALGYDTSGMYEVDPLTITILAENGEAQRALDTYGYLLEAGDINMDQFVNGMDGVNFVDQNGNQQTLNYKNDEGMNAFFNETSGSEYVYEYDSTSNVQSSGYVYHQAGKENNDTNQNAGGMSTITHAGLISAIKYKKECEEKGIEITNKGLQQYIKEHQNDPMDWDYLENEIGISIVGDQLAYNGEVIEKTHIATRGQDDKLFLKDENDVEFAFDDQGFASLKDTAGTVSDTQDNTLHGLMDLNVYFSNQGRTQWDGKVTLDYYNAINYGKYSGDYDLGKYRPEGISEEEWNKLQKEASGKIKKNMGSTSLQWSGGEADLTGKGVVLQRQDGTVAVYENIRDIDQWVDFAANSYDYFPVEIPDEEIRKKKKEIYEEVVKDGYIPGTPLFEEELANREMHYRIYDNTNHAYINSDANDFISRILLANFLDVEIDEKGNTPNGLHIYDGSFMSGEGDGTTYMALDMSEILKMGGDVLDTSSFARDLVTNAYSLLKNSFNYGGFPFLMDCYETLYNMINNGTATDKDISDYQKFNIAFTTMAEWYFTNPERFNELPEELRDSVWEIIRKYFPYMWKKKQEMDAKKNEDLGKASDFDPINDDGTSDITNELIEYLKSLGIDANDIPEDITFDWLKEHLSIEQIKKFFSTHVVTLERYVTMITEDITVEDTESMYHKPTFGSDFKWTVNGSAYGGGTSVNVVLLEKETHVTATETIDRRRTITTSYKMEETIVVQPFGWVLSTKTVSGMGMDGLPNVYSKKTVAATGQRTVLDQTFIIDELPEETEQSGGEGAWVTLNQYLTRIFTTTGYWINGIRYDLINGWEIQAIMDPQNNKQTTYRVK